MKQKVYIIETRSEEKKAFFDRNLFFKEWAYQLRKKLPCNAYIIDYSNYDTCDYKDYQYELENLIMFGDN